MTLIDSYCYCFSLRRGCFIIGIFTLIFHMGVVAGGSFYVHDTISVALLILSSIMVVLSIFCVITSVFLIVGLCVESKKLLIPWIVVVSVTTCMEVVFSNIVFFFKREINNENPDETDYKKKAEETPTLYALDILVVVLNIYSILCVLSQYQEYSEGRGTAEYDYRNPRRNKFKVTYSSQIKLDPALKWKTIENSESRSQLMINRHSLNTENSCVNSIVEDNINTSARSSITTTNADRIYDNNIRENPVHDPDQYNPRCDQTVVQLEPILSEDTNSNQTKSTFNDFS